MPQKLAALGDSQAMIQLGLECRNRQNYEEGIAWFFKPQLQAIKLPPIIWDFVMN
ncbi:MAG: hypothetical protein HWD61_06100 [Parachlamydiaceae bacterium]|nr:MAG: hypothetical protein HWD61_06100 [Parachlamydiaceae bacterium]